MVLTTTNPYLSHTNSLQNWQETGNNKKTTHEEECERECESEEKSRV
jgi:hypothetical protein